MTSATLKMTTFNAQLKYGLLLSVIEVCIIAENEFDAVQTVHRNQFYSETKKIHFMCFFQKCTLHVSNGYTVHHQELLIAVYAAVCTYHANCD